ncbi:MAG: glycoside hydrolase family 88 protein [Bacteroidales bacterium]|nr:glycoside hydrolase family 88 protein [Bacteroidales bacterium]
MLVRLASILFVCIITNPLFTQFPNQSDRLNIEKEGIKATLYLLSQSEFILSTTATYTGLHYAESAFAFGALRFAGLINDSSLVNKLVNRYTQTTREFIPNSANHVDVNVYGIVPLELYLKTRNLSFLKEGLDYADLQWDDTLSNGLTNQARYWVDDIWMISILQKQAYRITHNEVYLNRAAKTIAFYMQILQQPNGLFYHGSTARFYWGRGNGWAAAAMAEILEVLPRSNLYFSSIYKGYSRMMNELLKWQDEEGMWHQLIDKKNSFKESSSTAMFAYAMAVGINKGLLPRNKYLKSVQKAWIALESRIDENGVLADVCAGTGQSSDINYYLNRPKIAGDYHGQAAFLWLAYQMLLL